MNVNVMRVKAHKNNTESENVCKINKEKVCSKGISKKLNASHRHQT